MNVEEHLELMDWRRRIAALYTAVRSAQDPARAWREWRTERDRLFREHPQSPLPVDARRDFTGLAYFDYDPGARVLGRLSDAPRERHEIPTSGISLMAFDRIATATFEVSGRVLKLDVYWLAGYGGGMFVPFRDATSGRETYGAGRYLIDSIKGADLGTTDGQLVLDLNFAYNPSCSYDPRWVCPLAPAGNVLPVEVPAGERM